MEDVVGHICNNRNTWNTSCCCYRSRLCSYVSNKIYTKDVKADIKNLYEITVKLIDSNRQSKDETKKTMTAVNVIKDIVIKLFKQGEK